MEVSGSLFYEYDEVGADDSVTLFGDLSTSGSGSATYQWFTVWWRYSDTGAANGITDKGWDAVDVSGVETAPDLSGEINMRISNYLTGLDTKGRLAKLMEWTDWGCCE